MVMCLAVGCGDAEDTDEEETVVAPEPVAPLEVATPEEDGETVEGVDPPEPTAEGTAPEAAEGGAETPETMESLRARVAELEAQLASCQGATTPEGVDVPSTAANRTASAGNTAGPRNGTDTSGTPASGAAGTRRTNRGLLGTLLGPPDESDRQGGPSDRANGRDDEPEAIQLPDPTRILLGP